MWKIKKLAQFKKSLHTVTLGVAQKNTVKENILAYMKVHPVRNLEGIRHKNQTTSKTFILFFTKKHMYATLATILVLLTGTGTAFAAENTVPGDSLYGIKVHVNEPVRGALAVSTEARANWEAKVAERRLDEASRLAAKGELKADVETNLEARFKAQAEKIKTRIEKLEASGKNEAAANLSARLESAIQIHQEILTKFHSEDGTTKDEIKPLLKELKTEVQKIHKIRTKLETDGQARVGVEVKVAAENRMNASLKHINGVRQYLEQKHLSTTSSAMVKLEAALKVHAEGKSELEAGNYGKAFVIFGQAQGMAQEAKIMAHVGTELKIDARVNKILENWERKGIEVGEDAKIELENKLKGKLETKLENRIENKVEERAKENVKDRIENFKDNRIELKTGVSTTLNDAVNIL